MEIKRTEIKGIKIDAVIWRVTILRVNKKLIKDRQQLIKKREINLEKKQNKVVKAFVVNKNNKTLKVNEQYKPHNLHISKRNKPINPKKYHHKIMISITPKSYYNKSNSSKKINIIFSISPKNCHPKQTKRQSISSKSKSSKKERKSKRLMIRYTVSNIGPILERRQN